MKQLWFKVVIRPLPPIVVILYHPFINIKTHILKNEITQDEGRCQLDVGKRCGNNEYQNSVLFFMV